MTLDDKLPCDDYGANDWRNARGGEEELFNLITFRTDSRGVIVSRPACEAAYRQKLGFLVQTRDGFPSGNITGPCVLESLKDWVWKWFRR